MKAVYLIWITLMFMISGYAIHGHLNYIDNQNAIIISNQNQLIILLSKDYPELKIQKVKKRKYKIEKLKTLENEIFKLTEK